MHNLSKTFPYKKNYIGCCHVQAMQSSPLTRFPHSSYSPINSLRWISRLTFPSVLNDIRAPMASSHQSPCYCRLRSIGNLRASSAFSLIFICEPRCDGVRPMYKKCKGHPLLRLICALAVFSMWLNTTAPHLMNKGWMCVNGLRDEMSMVLGVCWCKAL